MHPCSATTTGGGLSVWWLNPIATTVSDRRLSGRKWGSGADSSWLNTWRIEGTNGSERFVRDSQFTGFSQAK